ATGGGAFIDPEIRAAVKAQGISVWLRADLELLLRRVSRRTDRPLLKRGEPREILERLMAARYPIYAEADLVVDSLDRPPGGMVDAVMAAPGTCPALAQVPSCRPPRTSSRADACAWHSAAAPTAS